MAKGWRPDDWDNYWDASSCMTDDDREAFESGADAILKAMREKGDRLMVGFVGEKQHEVKLPGVVIAFIPEDPAA